MGLLPLRPGLSRRRRVDRLEWPLTLLVQVLVQIDRVEIHFRPAYGDLDLRRPEDRVHDDPAEVLVGPVAVEVGPGEPEPTAAVLALVGPRHDLRPALADVLL